MTLNNYANYKLFLNRVLDTIEIENKDQLISIRGVDVVVTKDCCESNDVEQKIADAFKTTVYGVYAAVKDSEAVIYFN